MTTALIDDPEFPIGLFWPPPPDETSIDRYREIAEAGFTFLFTGNYVCDPLLVDHALTCADVTGLRVVAAGDPRVEAAMRYFTVTDDRAVALSIPVADAESLLRQVVDDFASHPSFAGINLMDEPRLDQFPNMARGVAAIQSLAPRLLPYVNLLPSTHTGPFDEYLGEFVRQVAPALISFDRYPFLADGEDEGYFADLATVSRHAHSAGVPAWLYVQTLAYDGHRTPTPGELLWQVNTALALGFTGIQYFTYWTPDAGRGEGFGPALLTRDGRTPRYHAVKHINRTWLAPAGRLLRRLRHVNVGHAGPGPVPAGLDPFHADAWLHSANGGVLVTALDDPDEEAVRYVFVCNAAHSRPAIAILRATRAVTRVEAYAPGQDQFAATSATDDITVPLPPGAGAVLRLTKVPRGRPQRLNDSVSH